MKTEEIVEAVWQEARRRGLSNADLSRLSGLDRMTIGVWFTAAGHGRQRSKIDRFGYTGKAPRLPTVICLAEALGMELTVRRKMDGRKEDAADPGDEPAGDRGL